MADLYEIYGMLTLEPDTRYERTVWHPLFQYKKQVERDASFNRLFVSEALQKGSGADEYEDFKKINPGDELPQGEWLHGPLEPGHVRPKERTRRGPRSRFRHRQATEAPEAVPEAAAEPTAGATGALDAIPRRPYRSQRRKR